MVFWGRWEQEQQDMHEPPAHHASEVQAENVPRTGVEPAEQAARHVRHAEQQEKRASPPKAPPAVSPPRRETCPAPQPAPDTVPSPSSLWPEPKVFLDTVAAAERDLLGLEWDRLMYLLKLRDGDPNASRLPNRDFCPEHDWHVESCLRCRLYLQSWYIWKQLPKCVAQQLRQEMEAANIIVEAFNENIHVQARELFKMAALGPQHMSDFLIKALSTNWVRERPWRTPPDLLPWA
jgi:hypothetical protein